MPEAKAIVFDPIACMEKFPDEFWAYAPTWAKLFKHYRNKGLKYTSTQKYNFTTRAYDPVVPPKIIDEFPEYEEFWSKYLLIDRKYFKEYSVTPETATKLLYPNRFLKHDWLEVVVGDFTFTLAGNPGASVSRRASREYDFIGNNGGYTESVANSPTKKEWLAAHPYKDTKDWEKAINIARHKAGKTWNKLRRAARSRTGADAEEKKYRALRPARITNARMKLATHLKETIERLQEYKSLIEDSEVHKDECEATKRSLYGLIAANSDFDKVLRLKWKDPLKNR